MVMLSPFIFSTFLVCSMASATFPKHIQVLADLTIANTNGDIRVENDRDGSLVVSFSDKRPFFDLLKAQLPQQANWKALVEANRSFYQNNQPFIVKVEGRPWITLGKSPLPRINYRRLVPPYVSSNPSLKNGLYLAGSALGAALLYAVFRKRN